MSRFYVGQRVRILWSRRWPELAGETGVIIAAQRRGSPRGNGSIAGDWHVAPDRWGSYRAPGFGVEHRNVFSPFSEQLAPLTDPGREVVSWSECVWRPEHLRVSEKECQR